MPAFGEVAELEVVNFVEISKVVAETEREAVYLHYTVADSGVGISSASADEISSKFEQADRRTHTEYGGSGLGLFIAQQLVEMQDGQIGVASQKGSGTTFAFYIKTSPSEEQATERSDVVSHGHRADGRMTDRLEVPREPRSPSDTHKITRKPHLPQVSYNMLLVEDNILDQQILAKQLRKAGCVVQVANHGGEAIDFVSRVLEPSTETGDLRIDHMNETTSPFK